MKRTRRMNGRDSDIVMFDDISLTHEIRQRWLDVDGEVQGLLTTSWQAALEFLAERILRRIPPFRGIWVREVPGNLGLSEGGQMCSQRAENSRGAVVHGRVNW